MTPDAASYLKKKKNCQNADFEGHYLLMKMTPKAIRNLKLGVIFAKCAPTTSCPHPMQSMPECLGFSKLKLFTFTFVTRHINRYRNTGKVYVEIWAKQFCKR